MDVIEEEIEVIDQLFIRACKINGDSYKRVLSVYKRFYFGGNKNPNPALVKILLRICEDFMLISTSQLIQDMNPSNHWKLGLTEDDDFNKCVVVVLISAIRLSHKNKFPGLRRPTVFDNNSRYAEAVV